MLGYFCGYSLFGFILGPKKELNYGRFFTADEIRTP